MQLSDQGRNLAAVVLGGLAAGTVLVLVGGSHLLRYFIQDNSYVMGGMVWQLATSIVVAPPYFGGVIDVAFNAMALVWLDGLFSMTYTKWQYYGVFVATGIAGNVFGLANGPSVSSFGASGGIFGLLAGVVSFDVATNRRVDPVLVMWFLAIFVVSSFLFSNVDSAAHAGGALLGLVLGYAIGKRRKAD